MTEKTGLMDEEFLVDGCAGCVLFDWGGTLMIDFPQCKGPMASWPQVEAMPHAHETLERIRALGWRTALATNADDSLESDIREALARVELDTLIGRVFCSREVGHRKPSPEFFAFIENDLGLPAHDLVMVGDDYTKDVEGASRCGIRAVWYRPGRKSNAATARRSKAAWRTIRDLRELPELLQNRGNHTQLGTCLG